jgi:hypothetical protein
MRLTLLLTTFWCLSCVESEQAVVLHVRGGGIGLPEAAAIIPPPPESRIESVPTDRRSDLLDRAPFDREMLYVISSVLLLEDGGIIVGDRFSQSVWRLEASTPEARLIVRGEGGGPEEFRAVSWVDVDPQGHLVVWDRPRARVTRWTMNGELLTEGFLHPRIYQQLGTPVGLLPDGSALFTSTAHSLLSDHQEDRIRNSVHVWRWRWSMDAYDEVARIEGPLLELLQYGGSRIAQRLLFTSEGLAVSTGELVALFDTGEGSVVLFDPEDPGQLRRLEVALVADSPVRSSEISEERRFLLSQLEGSADPVLPAGGLQELRRRSLAEVGAARHRPRIGSVRRDAATGGIWVSSYVSAVERQAGGNVLWCLLDVHAHEWARCLRVPTDHEVVGALGDLVVLLASDELGVQQLFRVTLDRP